MGQYWFHFNFFHVLFPIIIKQDDSSMSHVSKRSLRNSNNCPTVQNPLTLEVALSNNQLLPPAIYAQLRALPTLTCSQINDLPVLTVPGSPLEVLQAMQSAGQWQASTVKSSLKVESSSQNSEEYLKNGIFNNKQGERMLDEVKEREQEGEENIYSDFIMKPPPAQKDSDSQKL